jgi:hypothetical protein
MLRAVIRGMEKLSMGMDAMSREQQRTKRLLEAVGGLMLLMVWGVALAQQPLPKQDLAADSVPKAEPAKSDSRLREIDDSSCGAHWLLVKDREHPGGPGKLVRVEGSERAASLAAAPIRHGSSEMEARQMVIHAGDPLIVEQHTAILDARLEAVAVHSAAVGARFEVRLKVGGKRMQARAQAPGRAELLVEVPQ